MTSPSEIVARALTRLTPEQEAKYKEWKQTLPKPLQYEGDYDLRGAFIEGQLAGDPNGHMTDAHKLPNHPTFSRFSNFSVPADPGGQWVGNKAFWADPSNFKEGGNTVANLERYLASDDRKPLMILPDWKLPRK